MEAMADDFRLNAGYIVTGWSGFTLIASGLLLMLPVAGVRRASARTAASTRARATSSSAGAPRSTSWAWRWPASRLAVG